jgi:hypothetical protein
MEHCITLLNHSCRSHCVKVKECGNTDDDSDWLNIIVKNEFVFNSSNYIICIAFNQKIPGLEWLGSRIPARSARKRVYELIYVPYISDSILDFIKKIELSAEDNISNGTLVVAKIKKQIEDKLDEDSSLRQLRKFNIVDEIQQLKQSILPSKEITELQQTYSKLQYTTLQMTKKLDDIKEKSIQSELEIKQLLQEKEKQHSEMLSTKSTIQQMQEDIKLLLKKTSELHYENTLLTKMVEDEKIKTKQLSESLKESSGLSFTQANTIGQVLMKDNHVFNCM